MDYGGLSSVMYICHLVRMTRACTGEIIIAISCLKRRINTCHNSSIVHVEVEVVANGVVEPISNAGLWGNIFVFCNNDSSHPIYTPSTKT